MNSQKFMIIALILMAMIPGANPGEIFTGDNMVVISQLYPGLQEAFRKYATQIASAAAQEGQQLEVEVAADNALRNPDAFVSYFQGLDEKLRQEIFAGEPVTQEEVSAVWGMMTSFFKSLGFISDEATEIISSTKRLLSRNPIAALNALAQLAMVANCLKILYNGTRVISNVATSAVTAASSCGRITIKTLRGIVGLFMSSAASASAASAAGDVFASETPNAVILLRAVENHRELPDEATIDDILCLKCTLSGQQYVDLISALTANNLYTPPIGDAAFTPEATQERMQRSCSLMTLPRDIINQICSTTNNNTNNNNNKRLRSVSMGGRTKKHLKRKLQRKSSRKVKKSKRARAQKSRRYKK